MIVSDTNYTNILQLCTYFAVLYLIMKDHIMERGTSVRSFHLENNSTDFD